MDNLLFKDYFCDIMENSEVLDIDSPCLFMTRIIRKLAATWICFSSIVNAARQ